MDNQKIIKFPIEKESVQPQQKEENPSKKLHTNPIIQRMLQCNETAKKMKFKLKDWL